jgi:LPS-assembly lipoprotein
MSSPVKFFIALSLLLVGACGFTPMYGSGAGSSGVSATQGLDKVDIALIPDQSGVFLRNILIDNFYQDGYPNAPTHTLTVKKIKEQEFNLDITDDAETTRKQIRLTTTMDIIDRVSGQPVVTRDLIAITSYNVSGSQFTTRVSENDAREAALADLARQIEAQTALYFKR